MIEVTDVRKDFQRTGQTTVALSSISFRVPECQFLSIVGPSGCGKTTLLRCMAGLTAHSEGSIVLDKVKVRSPPKETVYLFQEYNRSLFPWRTVLGNVMFPVEFSLRKDEALSRARQYIGMVGLTEFENHYPWELSGGMQQRAAIARVLVKEPKYLLMDEPFGSVDAQTRYQLEDALLEIWTFQPRTVVFVTHDIEEAIYLSDRILVMSARPGKVLADISVDLPRPRDQITTREHHRFAAYRREVFGLVFDRHNR